MQALRLYDAESSPCARRVRMCLIEKGVPFEIQWMNLGLLDQKQSWYLGLNPSGLVPTLAHGGHTIFESNVINEYLEERFPNPPLMPADTLGRATVRMWLAFESGWAPLFRDVLYETFGKNRIRRSAASVEELESKVRERTTNRYYLKFARKTYLDEPDRELITDRLDVLMERMQWMEERLADGRTWLAGSRFSLADLSLIPRIDMYPAIGIEDLYERFPRIGAWASRVKEVPAWKNSDLRPAPGRPITFVEAQKS